MYRFWQDIGKRVISGVIIARISDIFAWPCIFRLSLPLFYQVAPSPVRPVGYLGGGAVASGDYPLAYPQV